MFSLEERRWYCACAKKNPNYERSSFKKIKNNINDNNDNHTYVITMTVTVMLMTMIMTMSIIMKFKKIMQVIRTVTIL